MSPARPARLALLAVLLGASPAAAFEATDNVVADAFLRSLEAAGFIDPSAGSVETDGTAVTLSAVESGPASPEGSQIAIASVVVENGVVDATNALIADRVRYEDLTITDPGQDASSTVAEMIVEGMRFPTKDGAGSMPSLAGGFDRLSAKDIAVRSPKDGTVPIAAIEATISGRDDEDFSAGTLVLDDLTLDVELWDDAAARQLRALGYEQVNLDVEAAGEWSAQGGIGKVDRLRLSIDDMGTIELAGRVDGLEKGTLDTFQTSLSDLNQLLALLQVVNVSELSLTFTDEGITERVVSDLASRSGQPREALADGLVGSLGAAIAPLGEAPFAQEVVEVARSFLASPGTLVLTATPREPVSVAQVIGAVLLSPQLLPDVLGLQIEARP